MKIFIEFGNLAPSVPKATTVTKYRGLAINDDKTNNRNNNSNYVVRALLIIFIYVTYNSF